MMKKRLLVLLLIIVVTKPAVALDWLRIDLQLPFPANVLQAGFESWAPATGVGMGAIGFEPVSWQVTDIGMQVTGENVQGNPSLAHREWDDVIGSVKYDPNDNMDDLSDLYNECVFAGARLWLTFIGLEPGTYKLITHHNAYVHYDPGLIDIELSIDGGSTYALLYDDFQMGRTGNNGDDPGSPIIHNPEPVDPAVFTFTVSSVDPNDAVVVQMTEAGNPSGVDWNNPVLNGYELVKISEIGDINEDGVTDSLDLEILANQWLQTPGTPSADIAPSPIADGFVNYLDFAALAQYW